MSHKISVFLLLFFFSFSYSNISNKNLKVFQFLKDNTYFCRIQLYASDTTDGPLDLIMEKDQSRNMKFNCSEFETDIYTRKNHSSCTLTVKDNIPGQYKFKSLTREGDTLDTSSIQDSSIYYYGNLNPTHLEEEKFIEIDEIINRFTIDLLENYQFNEINIYKAHNQDYTQINCLINPQSSKSIICTVNPDDFLKKQYIYYRTGCDDYYRDTKIIVGKKGVVKNILIQKAENDDPKQCSIKLTANDKINSDTIITLKAIGFSHNITCDDKINEYTIICKPDDLHVFEGKGKSFTIDKIYNDKDYVRLSNSVFEYQLSFFGEVGFDTKENKQIINKSNPKFIIKFDKKYYSVTANYLFRGDGRSVVKITNECVHGLNEDFTTCTPLNMKEYAREMKIYYQNHCDDQLYFTGTTVVYRE